MEREIQRLVPYHLSTEIVALSASTAVTLTVSVPGDADFECRYITHKVTSALLSVLYRDGGTRMEMMNRATYAGNVAGSAAQPYVLPSPALFVRNSNIEFDVVDLSGSTNTLQITFCGFLTYPGPVMSG